MYMVFNHQVTCGSECFVLYGSARLSSHSIGCFMGSWQVLGVVKWTECACLMSEFNHINGLLLDYAETVFSARECAAGPTALLCSLGCYWAWYA
jgi:hypothetical protein